MGALRGMSARTPGHRKASRKGRRAPGTVARTPDVETTGEMAALRSALRESRAELEALRAERVALSRTIAHELRTSLQGIMGQALMLGEPDLPPERQRRHLATLLQEADRLASVVQDACLQIALDDGRTVFQPADMALGALLVEAAQACEHLFPDSVVDVLEADSLPLVYADPFRVRQVIDCVLRNAVRLSSRQGAMGPSASDRPLLSRVAITCRVNGGRVRIAVRCSGAPIPAGCRESIFDRCPGRPGLQNGQTKGQTARWPVTGLFAAREIARRLGGDLVLKSHARGNTFAFSLPAAGSP